MAASSTPFPQRASRGRREHAAMTLCGAERQRFRLAHLAVLCAVFLARVAVARSTGPRTGPAGGLQNVPLDAPRTPRHSIAPYVIGLQTVNGDSYVNGSGAYSYVNSTNTSVTLYLFVEFSERIVVSGTPALVFATGAHFETGAANVSATFLGGGATLTKGFWRNDATSPLLSGLPPPCRAGGMKAAVAGGAFNLSNVAYNASRPWGAAYCVPGAAPEQRAEESMARSLAFGFDVLPQHRTARLDVTDASALTLPSGAAIVGEATGIAALTTLPPPGNPATGVLGGPGSLSAAARLVVGAPFVVNVTSPFPTRRVTLNGTVIDILVSWSEPLAVACGPANTAWQPLPSLPPQDRFSPPVAPAAWMCPAITLALAVGSGPNTSVPLVAQAPSTWPPPLGCPPPAAAVLRFRYVARQGDSTLPRPLQYAGRGALQLASGSAIVRAADSAAAGIALPPSRFDAALGGVDHWASLAGMRQLVVVVPP